jgi:hypothetical protein
MKSCSRTLPNLTCSNPLALKVLGGLYPHLSGATARLSNQDLVVDLMDCERYVVSQ